MTTRRAASRPAALVIGAGVIGLTTAVRLAEAGLAVRVDTARPAAETTSAAAGASWDPYLIEPRDRVSRWSIVALDVFRKQAADPDTAVRLVPGTHQSRLPTELPDWATTVGARPCRSEELRPGYVTGWHYRAPVIDMPRYLGWLQERLLRAGGSVRFHVYRSLATAQEEAPVVVNCTGSGAATLVPDPSLTTVRGQLVVVRNPGIEEFFCDDTPDASELVYVYPHGDTAVLGGTAEPGQRGLRPSAAAAEAILRRCAAVLPALRDVSVLGTRVGLRPVRPEVRLEAEAGSAGSEGTLIHNYGHGGAGVTTSWGCAEEVLGLVRARLTA